MKPFQSVLAALTAVSMLTGSALPCAYAATPSETTRIDGIDGTFIQPWLYMTYDEEQWDNEMKTLKEIGVDYLIMGDVANHNTDGTWTVYYPSELDFLSGYTVYDALEPILSHCAEYDIKLYLGMGLDCAWNSDITTAEGREANKQYMTQCNQITTELYNKYKAAYPDTYYGFYFVTELFNTVSMNTDTGIDAYAEGLDEMFTMVLDNCNALDPTMPLLFSPYVNIFGYAFSCINIDRFTEYWAEVLGRIPFRDGDMICPQDSCGGGGMDTAHIAEWTQAYRNAVDRANAVRGTKLLLGTNAEMFIQPDADRMSSPHGVSYTGIKDVRDFTFRLETADQYVDALFCFAYPHNYSPYNNLPQYHACFMEYLETGEIESVPPTPPTDAVITIKEENGIQYPQLTFSGMTDNTAVAHTNIYKNGKLYDYIVPAVNVGGNTTQNIWVDYNHDSTESISVYEIECIDVCGNVSERCTLSFSYAELLSQNQLQIATAILPPTEKDALDYLSYNVTDGGVRITDCDRDAVNIVIPDTIEGKPVTVIDWYAFERCDKLQSITIPDTVTHISRYAFAHCISLETVNMPQSLYAIEQYAFHDCPKLKGIDLPEQLNIIEQRAFSGCSAITEVTIPESCNTIGEYAFIDCDSLYTVTVNADDITLAQRSLGYIYDNGYAIKAGFTIDTDRAAAIAYANENGIPLRSATIAGDVNEDGSYNLADLVMLQNYLVGSGTLGDWVAGDLVRDGVINAMDLTAMLRMNVYINSGLPYSV